MFQKALVLHPLGLRDRIALVDQFSWNSPAPSPGAEPVCLAGEIHHLIGLSVQKTLGLASFESVNHSVVALVRPGCEPLTESIREQLWRAFHVPVLAVLLDEDNRVLAQECLAGKGLHVAPGTRWQVAPTGSLRYKRVGFWPGHAYRDSGICGALIPHACDCGRDGLRVELHRSAVAAPASLSAIAAAAAAAAAR